MAINQKYSYNGYDPKSQAIIDKKVELKQKFIEGTAISKSFYGGKRSEILVLNEELKKFEITLIGYKLAIKLIRDELKQILKDNDAFEYKDYSAAISDMKRGWKRKSLVDEPAKDFNNTEIVSSCFAQDEPFTDVFPPGMTGVTFVGKCNLGNCNIPPGNTVEGFNKHYKTQNDGEYWVIDTELKPIEPLSPKRYERFALSKDPKDLPAEMMEESIIVQAEKAKAIEDEVDAKKKELEDTGYSVNKEKL